MTNIFNPDPRANQRKAAIDGVPDDVWVARCRAQPVAFSAATNLIVAACVAKAIGAATEFRKGELGAARASLRDLLAWMEGLGFVEPGLVSGDEAMAMLERAARYGPRGGVR